MFRAARLTSSTLGVLAFLFMANSASAQVVSAPPARPVITQNIDEGNLVALRGNTRAEARATNDRGAVANDLLMEHMLLQLRRSPEQEQALQKYIYELQTKGSPNFHRWITAQEFGARFGLAQRDLDTITRWLGSHGFKVNIVYPNGMVIDFSGTAGQVREAFKAEIHYLDVNGLSHVANTSDPQVPADLLRPLPESSHCTTSSRRPCTRCTRRGPILRSMIPLAAPPLRLPLLIWQLSTT